MSRRPMLRSLLPLALLTLAACGERAQTAGGASAGKPGDAPAWQGVAAGRAAAPDWKAGDARSWEEHLRARAQNQNEYARTAARH